MSEHQRKRGGSYTRVRDRASVSEAEACDERGVIRDGYMVHWSVHMMDSALQATGATSLYDPAGKPVTLTDKQTGQPVTLNADLIAAIEAEAARLGLSVKSYLNEVVGFVAHTAALSSEKPA